MFTSLVDITMKCWPRIHNLMISAITLGWSLPLINCNGLIMKINLQLMGYDILSTQHKINQGSHDIPRLKIESRDIIMGIYYPM